MLTDQYILTSNILGCSLGQLLNSVILAYYDFPPPGSQVFPNMVWALCGGQQPMFVAHNEGAHHAEWVLCADVEATNCVSMGDFHTCDAA